MDLYPILWDQDFHINIRIPVPNSPTHQKTEAQRQALGQEFEWLFTIWFTMIKFFDRLKKVYTRKS